MTTPTGTLTASIVPSSLGGDPQPGVNWGRWRGDYTVLEEGVPFNTGPDFHFIYSENLTSPTQLSNLGGLGGSVQYMLDSTNPAGTLPTDHLGNVGQNMPGIYMDVDFLARWITNYDIYASVAGKNYAAGASNIAFQDLDKSFQLQGIDSPCPSGADCTGEASIIFVGNQAQGTMNAYHIVDDGKAAITGTALLIRQPVLPQKLLRKNRT